MFYFVICPLNEVAACLLIKSKGVIHQLETEALLGAWGLPL